MSTAKVILSKLPPNSLTRRRLLSGWLFLCPALLLLAAVVLYPLLRGIWMSFTDYNLQHRETLGQFIGLSQYQALFDDRITRLAIKNTVVFGFISIFSAFTIGFGLALLLIATFAQAGIIDEMNTELTDSEKKDLAESISPIGKLIAILQYLAGAVIVLGIIAAGYTYYKGDPASKQATLNKIGAIIIGSILVFGAVTIARLLGLGG